MAASTGLPRTALASESRDESSNTDARASGIILAGTYPWTNSRFDRLLTRPLIPVANRPLIGYALSLLRRAGIRRATVCGNRNTQALGAWLESHREMWPDLSYLEDPMPRGSAGCVLDAAAADTSQTFVVTDGTSIPSLNLTEVLETHRSSGADATVVVYSDARLSGQVPRIPVGIYVFEGHALRALPRRGFLGIKEHLIPMLVREGGRVVTHEASSTLLPVWNQETYLAANEFVVEAMTSNDDVPEGYQRRDDALIHDDAMVEDDVILAGPILIAAGATIGSKAVLVGPTSIGLDVTVGAGATVSRSAVWRRATVRPSACVDRAVIADDSIVD